METVLPEAGPDCKEGKSVEEETAAMKLCENQWWQTQGGVLGSPYFGLS